MESRVLQAPLWGSQWDGQLTSSCARIAAAELPATLVKYNWSFRESISSRRFLLESCVQTLATAGSNTQGVLQTVGPLFGVKQALVDNAAAKMKEFPTPAQTSQIMTIADMELSSADGFRLSPKALPGNIDSVFVAIAVLPKKNATSVTLYRSASLSLAHFSSNPRIPGSLVVGLTGNKSTLLSIGLWGSHGGGGGGAGEQHVQMLTTTTLPVRKLKTTKAGQANELQLEGAAFSCRLTVSARLDKTPEATVGEYIRTVHRHILHHGATCSFELELDKHAVRASPVKKGSSNRTIVLWSGKYNKRYAELINVLEEQLPTTALQHTLDRFCVLIQIQISTGVETEASLACLTRLLDAYRGTGHAVLPPSDEARMAEAVDVLLVDCANRIATPFSSFDTALIGTLKRVTTEVTACVHVLQLIYGCEMWHTHTGRSPQTPGPSSSPAPPIVAAARKYVLDHHMATEQGYDRADMKAELVAEFGQTAFFQSKVEIEHVLLQGAHQAGSSVENKKGLLMARLAELLDGEDATLSAVKEKLIREFGKKYVGRQKAEINAAVLRQMDVRRGVAAPRRRLEKDLIAALEEHIGQRYELLQKRCTPEMDYEGADIVVLTRVANVIVLDVELCEELFAKLYAQIDGFNLTEAVFDLYGMLLAADLRDLLQRWQPKNSGTDLAAVLFELYFAIRDLVEPLRPKLSPATVAHNPLYRYTAWFEPFIVYWMRLSQLHARTCISNAVKQDSLRPVTGSDLFTGSVVDVFKVLLEMLQFYTDLKWSDKESAVQTLLPCLIDTITSSVKFYAKGMLVKVLGKAGTQMKVDRSFVVDTALACGLNSLDEALVRFNAISKMLYARHLTRKSDFDNRCKELFLAVRAEIAASKGDIMYRIGASLRPRIRSDLTYLLFHLPAGDRDLPQYVDDQLSPLLDDPEVIESGKSSPQGSSNKPSFSLDRLMDRAKAAITDLKDNHMLPLITPTQNGYLCQNLMAISEKIQKGSTVGQLVACIWGHMLQVIRDIVCTVYRPLPEMLRPPSAPHTPESLFEFDKILPKKPENMRPGFHQRVATTAHLVLDQMTLFFNDDGDGVESGILLAMADRVFSHVLMCCEMTTSNLIAHFLQKVTALQVVPIRRADAIARKAPDAGPAKARKSATDTSYPAGIFVDELSGKMARNRTAKKPRQAGSLMLRLYYDHEEDFAQISVLDGRGLSTTNPIYYKLRVLPRYKEDAVKMRSDRMNDETFKVPEVLGSLAIQLRVQEQSAVKKQKYSVVGEIMIQTQALICTTREIVVEMPLHAGGYGGEPGEALQLIWDRSKFDSEAKDFMSMYKGM